MKKIAVLLTIAVLGYVLYDQGLLSETIQLVGGNLPFIVTGLVFITIGGYLYMVADYLKRR